MEYEQRKRAICPNMCLLKKISIFAASTFDLYIHPYGHAQVMAGSSCNQQGINQPSVEKITSHPAHPPRLHLKRSPPGI